VRLPFFYGWLIVAIAFVTMAVGVNARTAFSLLFPPILAEFGWDRGLSGGSDRGRQRQVRAHPGLEAGGERSGEHDGDRFQGGSSCDHPRSGSQAMPLPAR